MTRTCLLVLATLLAGCTSLYLDRAGPAPEPPPPHRLAAWLDREYCSGIVFNGQKIGFSHVALAPAADASGLFEIRSDAAFVLRFLGFDKRIMQKVAEVAQRIEAYERSPLFEGNAFRVETQMEGYRVRTWINAQGQPLLEIGMNGVLISGLEDEKRAKSYFAAASLNKAEALIEFALVRPERPLAPLPKLRVCAVPPNET